MLRKNSIKEIKIELERLGVDIPRDRFDELSYSQIKVILAKATKAYNLYEEVDAIVRNATSVKPPIDEE